MFDDCVIMAGGSGTRLWPASSSKKPKQFLPASKDSGKNFFFMSAERALALTEASGGRVIVIAGETHIPHVIESCRNLTAAEKKRLVLIPEPEAKNTAPAIACAAVFANLTGADRRMLVLTSDHLIGPLETFKANAAAASDFAGQERLVVFGIPPSRPETGYGYIEAMPLSQARNTTGSKIFAVAAFREKPDLAAAKRFVAAKRFYWNSGMFAFSAAFMAGCFRRLAPDVIRPFEKLKVPPSAAWTMRKGLRVLSAWPGLTAAYRKTKNISFDYAVAEKCGKTVMVRADFGWIDIGNWEEYTALLGDTGSEVYRTGENSCFVDSDIPVALAGVEDLIVVIRSGKNGGPAALITRKGETQRVRDIVEQIKKAGKKDLL